MRDLIRFVKPFAYKIYTKIEKDLQKIKKG